MAVFGEIVLFLFGFTMFVGGLLGGRVAYGFAGKIGLETFIPAVLGIGIMFAAIHYGPITFGVK